MTRVIKRRNGKWNGERGSILALSALSMVSILLALGLSVDMGHFYLVAAELQNAADAAALSGATALNSGPSGITLAVDRAVNGMNKYEFNKTGVTIARSDVRFGVLLTDFDNGTDMDEATADDEANAPTIRFVKVTVPPKAVKVFFAVSTLGTSVNLSKSAVAGASVSLNYFCNIAPLSVVQDDETGEPLNVEPGCPNQTEYTPGCTYTVRLQSGNFVSPGNYLILDLDGGGGGANQVAQDLARGTNSCYSTDDTVDTKTGVNTGPVSDGINTRFDMGYGSHGLNPAQHPPDTNVRGRNAAEAITYAQYVSGDSTYFQAPPNNPTYGVGDRRVMVVPILNLSQFGNGKTKNISISKFGAFFIQKIATGPAEIRAEYIGERAVFGDGGYDPTASPGPNPSLTVAVLYR
ncbi:MAG: pilus assembly protein TadG-related protein [Blastocatellales bacterium]